MLARTPFHGRTAPLVRGAAWRRWGGYQVASSYEPTPEREYAAIRNAAALIDISPLSRYVLAGRDSERFLNRVVTRDVRKCAPGRVVYTLWCDGDGRVVDDGTVARLSDEQWRLTSGEPALRWLHLNGAGFDVSISDVTHSGGALALQGPLSREVLAAVAGDAVDSLPWFGAMNVSIAGVPVSVTRTGYTGDLGYELFLDARDAHVVWDSLCAAGEPYGLTPAGIWALDIARIEAGLIMLGVDYHSAHAAVTVAQTVSPFELGAGRLVATDKGPYNGRQALERERGEPSGWRLCGVTVDWESFERLFSTRGLPPAIPAVAWRGSTPVRVAGRQVGYATSACWSPLLKQYIALAHLQAPYNTPGSHVAMELGVEHERLMAGARVVALPFLDLERKRL